MDIFFVIASAYPDYKPLKMADSRLNKSDILAE